MNKRRTIYLDHAATTPVHPDVVAAMMPFWTECYGNSSSIHMQGRKANNALEKARYTIAELLNAQPKEIIFTGCGSESDNLAVRGAMMAARRDGRGNHLIVSCIEHKAVLATAKQLRDLEGFALTILPVDRFGRVNSADVEAAITPQTVLISIMAANNEIGTLQPIAEIGRIARNHNILFHTDAIQAISTTAWDMQTDPIDLLSLSPHKFRGPKGIGILYVRDGVDLVPQLVGGGQENGLRSGTSNVAFAVGAAKALAIAQAKREQNVAHYSHLRKRLTDRLLAALPDDCIVTGHPSDRLPFHASFAIRNVRGNDLLIYLDLRGICASSGSACNVGNPKPSHVLQAIGLSDEWTTGGLRLSLGSEHTESDVDYIVETLVKAVKNLQRMAQYQ